jgi:chemotaxis protein CheC
MVIDESVKQDFFKELANVGVGNAATSLSKMIDSKVTVTLPNIKITPVERLTKNKSGNFCIITMGIKGDVRGTLVCLLYKETSFWLINRLNKNTDVSDNLNDDMNKSTLKEFLNIIGGSFLNSLSTLLNYKLIPNPPNMFTGTGLEIKDILTKFVAPTTSNMLHAETRMVVDSKELAGELFLILNKNSFEEMLKNVNLSDN